MSRKRREIIVLALSMIAILLIVCFVVTDARTTAAQERYLDAEELHYDANGPFILIDRETAQMGYYDASTPIYHLHGDRIHLDLEPFVYRVYIVQNGLYFEADGYAFVMMLTEAELKHFKNMPDGIPALVR